MNEFIKYIWQLTISTSNATLEVPSLRPWNIYIYIYIYIYVIYIIYIYIYIYIVASPNC